MRNYYVLVSYDNGETFSVLNLKPSTWQECKDSIDWQKPNEGEVWCICKAVQIFGGRFQCIDTGKYIKPTHGCFTLKAWGDFLSETFRES